VPVRAQRGAEQWHGEYDTYTRLPQLSGRHSSALVFKFWGSKQGRRARRCPSSMPPASCVSATSATSQPSHLASPHAHHHVLLPSSTAAVRAAQKVYKCTKGAASITTTGSARVSRACPCMKARAILQMGPQQPCPCENAYTARSYLL